MREKVSVRQAGVLQARVKCCLINRDIQSWLILHAQTLCRSDERLTHTLRRMWSNITQVHCTCFSTYYAGLLTHKHMNMYAHTHNPALYGIFYMESKTIHPPDRRQKAQNFRVPFLFYIFSVISAAQSCSYSPSSSSSNVRWCVWLSLITWISFINQIHFNLLVESEVISEDEHQQW